MKTTIVVGNPKRGSRTLTAATELVTAITGAAPSVTVDLADLGPALLNWGEPSVTAAVDAVRSSDLCVIASPTYKATYTGLLKLFLDQFEGGTGMQDIVVVPLMLGGGPTHALAPELCLRPVLAELGATMPAPGLYLIDSTFADDGRLEDYAKRWTPALKACATLSAPTTDD